MWWFSIEFKIQSNHGCTPTCIIYRNRVILTGGDIEDYGVFFFLFYENVSIYEYTEKRACWILQINFFNLIYIMLRFSVHVIFNQIIIC